MAVFLRNGHAGRRRLDSRFLGGKILHAGFLRGLRGSRLTRGELNDVGLQRLTALAAAGNLSDVDSLLDGDLGGGGRRRHRRRGWRGRSRGGN